MTTIEIKVDKTLTALAGYSYGKYIFDTQVAPVFDEDEISIVFPEHITCLAISFVEGFTHTVGKVSFYKQIGKINGCPFENKKILKRLSTIQEKRISLVGHPHFIDDFIEDLLF